jgi:hypothetical protein
LTIRFFRKSGTISERDVDLFCPEPQDARPTVRITDADVLYRRYQPHHFDAQGDLNPVYFAFPNKKDKNKSGQSFLLQGLASAFHALHRNCNDGKRLGPGEWGVLKLSAAGIPKSLKDPENRSFYFKPLHTPYSTCKAHSELFCSDKPDGTEYVTPGNTVKTELRILLARQFKPTGIKMIVEK